MLLKPYRKSENEIFDPFHDFDMMERAMFGHPEFRNEAFIRTDIKEKENEYVLEAELPGFKKEDIDVEIEDGYLTISANRNYEHEEKDKDGNFIMRERRSGSFKRSYDTTGVDVSNVKARFENGVLTLEMPKLVEQKPENKHLEIQ